MKTSESFNRNSDSEYSMKYNSRQLSWLLYDPANAAYALIVRTVFAPLFLGYCAKSIYSESDITSCWSICASGAGLAAGIISVLCGPWADRNNKKLLMVKMLLLHIL